MLQQTRVDAVLPYYNRWLATFPTLDSLACADLHDVLKQWEGLGYYSRARNLHNAARLVRERFDGRIPSSYEALRALPGIGEYTAGAIASISYKENRPAVDGNVRRVLSRIFDIADPRPGTIRQAASSIVDPERPGDLNQALMDFGSALCTPRDPACSACPLQHGCAAFERGTVAIRPARKIKKAVPHGYANTLLCIEHGNVLLRQRPENGLLGGLWEFPECTSLPPGAALVGEVTHTFSHKRLTYRVYLGSPIDVRPADRWVPFGQLSTYPLSLAQRKIEDLLAGLIQPGR